MNRDKSKIWQLRVIPVTLPRWYIAKEKNWWTIFAIPRKGNHLFCDVLAIDSLDDFMFELIDQLKTLMIDGAEIWDAYRQENFHFQCEMYGLVCDKLQFHELLGQHRSFAKSYRWCLRCRGSKDDPFTPYQQRNRNDHLQSVQALEVFTGSRLTALKKHTGVSGPSILWIYWPGFTVDRLLPDIASTLR